MTEEKKQATVDPKFIKKIQGNEFITHEGLLSMFHNNGGKSIETKMILCEKDLVIFKAEVAGDNGTFTGHGDATDKNVNSMIAEHKIRMAETRAINRALRFYNNIGMCSADELGGDKPAQKTEPATDNVCIECKAPVTDGVKKYSLNIYKKVMCQDCQKKQSEKNNG